MEDIIKKEELLDQIDELGDNDTFIVTKSKGNKDKIPAPYTLMGNGKTNRQTGITSLDIVTVFMELNKGEMAVFHKFRDAIVRNSIEGEHNPNIVFVKDLDPWTDYEKMALSKNYSHMEAVGVLFRLQRGKYMVNPLLVLPSKRANEIIKYWNDITAGDTNDN